MSIKKELNPVEALALLNRLLSQVKDPNTKALVRQFIEGMETHFSTPNEVTDFIYAGMKTPSIERATFCTVFKNHKLEDQKSAVLPAAPAK
ncbi:MAG: hypothetical protein EBX40_07375 [Gammaproteobacteria bacterium]|nr:hypothetical protein [Gammaproteobacteria bacterium]